jgi:hypothetical protein
VWCRKHVCGMGNACRVEEFVWYEEYVCGMGRGMYVVFRNVCGIGNMCGMGNVCGIEECLRHRKHVYGMANVCDTENVSCFGNVEVWVLWKRDIVEYLCSEVCGVCG